MEIIAGILLVITGFLSGITIDKMIAIGLAGRVEYEKENKKVKRTILCTINAIGWLLVYIKYGTSINTVVYSAIASWLIIISVTDLKVQEIPIIFTLCIGISALLRIFCNKESIKEYLLGAVILPVLLLLLFIATSGKGIGIGDIKLEVAFGLLLGWRLSLVAFYIGCILLVIAYPILKKAKIKGFETHRVPFGPYLCMGAYLTILLGNIIYDIVIRWLFGG